MAHKNSEVSGDETPVSLLLASKFDALLELIPERDRQERLVALSKIVDVSPPMTYTPKVATFLFRAARLRLAGAQDEGTHASLVAKIDQLFSGRNHDLKALPETGKDLSKQESTAVSLFPNEEGRDLLAEDINDTFLGRLIPAPLKNATSQEFSRWVNGQISSPSAFALSFRLSEAAETEMMDLEARVTATPSAYGKDPEYAKSFWPSKAKAQTFFSIVERKLGGGVEAISDDRVIAIFRAAISRVLSDYFPENEKWLRSAAPTLTVGGDLLHAMKLSLALEANWSDERFHSGPIQLLAGSPSPSSQIRPGLSIGYMVAQHYITGSPPIAALSDALNNVRLAMALRDTNDADFVKITSRFDSIYTKDCLAPLSDYSVVTEPELEVEETHTP